MNKITYYLTEDLPGLRLIEQANNNSGILTLEKKRKEKESITLRV